MAFIREASQLAINAEKKHGVPASALAAMAIAESGYGWTRVALHANNPFGWKAGPSAVADVRKAYTPGCQSSRARKVRYIVFASKAEAFDFVAAKLATLDAYREYTEAYRAAHAGGAQPALNAWLSGVASRYSSNPAEFTKKIMRIMNNAIDPSNTVSPDYNLYQLSPR
jgi:flagellum-specific peptidoglycan hydrolase FlgJ